MPNIKITEDLVEEVARLHGLEKIKGEIPKMQEFVPGENKEFELVQAVRKILSTAGFSEIYGRTFTDKGDVKVIKAMAQDKEYLRTTKTCLI